MSRPSTSPPTSTARLASALVAAALALTPALASAQTPGRAPAVVELPAGTRAAALGHAFQLGMPSSDVLFANPAFLGRADGMIASVTVLGRNATALQASAATGWFDGAVGVGVRSLQHEASTGRLRPGGLDGVMAPGDDGASELVGTVGYARSLFGLRLGVSASLLELRTGELQETSASVDVGVASALGPFTVGLALQGLGPEVDVGPVSTRSGRAAALDQPLRLTLGVGAYGKPVGPLDIGFAGAVTLRDDEELVGGGGLEVGYWPVVGRTFVLRVGARTVPEVADGVESEASPFTLGGAFWGDDLVLEYAWQPMDGPFDGVHRFGVGWR